MSVAALGDLDFPSRSASAMWCAPCQSEVTDEGANGLCPQCGSTLHADPTMSLSARSGLDADLAAVLEEHDPAATVIDASSPDFLPSVDPVDDDDFGACWDEQLHALQTLLEEVKSVSNRPVDWLAAVPRETPPVIDAPTPTPPQTEKQINWTNWFVISSGVMLFVCGAILIGWSALGSRAELWRLGLPLAFVGQATLIIGIVLQLEWLWQFHRQTHHTLGQLGSQLHRIQLHTSARSSESQSVYAHPSEHAAPHMSLADRKERYSPHEQPE